MTRTQYLRGYVFSLTCEALCWAAFGALSWTAVLDADAFVRLIEQGHYALALLICIGILAWVAGATVAIPTLRSSRYWMRVKRSVALANDARRQQVRRLELLAQEPINSNADARKVLRLSRTMPGAKR